MTERKGTLAFDFDGVFHPNSRFHWPLERADFGPLREAMDRGYAVAIVTGNFPHLVAAELGKHGFKTLLDPGMSRARWEEVGRVLVTNRKISALAYVDDRGIRWSFGQDPADIFNVVETLRPGPRKREPWRPFRHRSHRRAA